MLKLFKFWKRLGPGIITGAADDDPSGIATYSLAGARFGMSMLWLAIAIFPFMSSIQEMCARIGMVTKKGLSGTMRTHYTSKWAKLMLVAVAIMVGCANTFNIGADVAAMIASAKLIFPNVNQLIMAIGMVGIIGLVVVLGSYHMLVGIFKWLTLVLFLYVGSALVANLNWKDVMMGTILPQVTWSKEYITMLVAVLGTTISPYLFFWQASEEVEQQEDDARERGITRVETTMGEIKMMRKDVVVGMAFSNLAMFFIIAATAGTLHAHGIWDIATPAQAALALEPIAGKFSALLFTVGVIGTGMLAIPVLAGSSAYAISEVFGWNEGLNKSWHKAKAFYGVFVISLAVGLVLAATGYDPIVLLFYTAVLFGVISPPLILLILVLANDKRIMKDKVNGWVSNTLGIATLIAMSVAAVSMFVLS